LKRYNAFDIDFRKSGNRLLIARVGQERSVWIPEKPGFEKKVTAQNRFGAGNPRVRRISIFGGILNGLKEFGRKLHVAIIGSFENSSR